MEHVKYTLVATFIFIVTLIAAMVIGGILASGAYQYEPIIVALSMVSGITVACTFALIDEIRNTTEKLKNIFAMKPETPEE